MKQTILVILAALSFLQLAPSGAAAETNGAAVAPATGPKAELKALVTQVRTKLSELNKNKLKPNETNLASCFQQFDALRAKYKDQKTDEVAEIVLMEAQLYLEILDDLDKGGELLKQIKRDYPDTKTGQQAKKMVQDVERQAAAKKIRSELVEGALFPDFNETDLAGKPLSVANYKGKVVLVDFWATWCGPCVGELPNVIKAYEKYHAKGFEIIGISLDRDKDREKLESFLKEKHMTWQQFYDGKWWGNKLAVKYGINSIPATYLLDASGKIIGKDLRGDALDQAVAKALSKN